MMPVLLGQDIPSTEAQHMASLQIWTSLISISIPNIQQFLKQKRNTIPFSLTTSVSSLGCICGISDCQSLRKNKQGAKSHVWFGFNF